MSALPVNLTYRLSPFLRPGEIFRIYAASPAIAANLARSIVVARQQRKDRVEYVAACNDSFEEDQKRFLMEELQINAWDEHWLVVEPSEYRLLHADAWGSRAFIYDLLFLPPSQIVFYSYNDDEWFPPATHHLS